MLKVSNVSKSFGSFTILNNISFSIDRGEILGLIGQNGSGKTTLFRIILNLISSDRHGEVLWNNKCINHYLYSEIGYLPEQISLYKEMTIEEHIMFFGELKGMNASHIKKIIDNWLKRFQVKGDRHTKISSLSKGNQQKVQVISTLIHEPKLIILDEPFSGLDSINADYLKKSILELKDKGSCIIFSSHNLQNVEEICDSILMIHNGEQIFHGTIPDIKKQIGRTYLTIDAPHWSVKKLMKLKGVKSVTKNKYYTLSLVDESYGPTIFDIITQDYYPEYFSQTSPSLESIFKKKVKELDG